MPWSESDFADLFENGAIPQRWVGPDGMILNANRAELELFGYTPDEYIGHHIAEFHADPLTIEEMLRRLARHETLRDYEARMRCKDGSIKHVLIDSNVRWQDGRFVHTRCFTRDVTERDRVERLRVVEHTATRVLSAAMTLEQAVPEIVQALAGSVGWTQGAVWLLDRDLDALRCVAAWRSFVADVVDFEKREPGMTRPATAGVTGRAVATATAVFDANGARETVAVPIELGGEVLGVIEMHGHRVGPPDDVLRAALGSIGSQLGQFVERKRVEQEHGQVLALEAARRREAEVLAQIARSINASLDLGDVLQTVAEGARELCGSDLSAIALREIDSGEMVFRHRAGDRYLRDRRAVVTPGVGAGGHVLATGRPCRSTNIQEDPRFAGDRLTIAADEQIVSVMVVPITIDERIEGLLYVDNRSLRPFTDRDEAILLQLAEHAAIAIRNAQLLAREQQARAEAETANRMKDEFLATLSHELRTPLNAVLGWAVTLRSAHLDEATTDRALEAIERNARAQSQLIEDLLDISRIVTGKLRLDMRLVDAIAVIETALDAVRPAAEAKSIRLQPMLDTRAGPIAGDPTRLQQVVWNLLSNAIKFTPEHGRVQLRLARGDSHVEIVVSDTGQGIAPDLLPHVFDRFRQADAGGTSGQGLGIGLALVRHIVDMHGGAVQAQSDGPGHGATFTVRLPLLGRGHGAADDRRHGLRRERAGASLPAHLGGVRVLIVEDERDTLDLFEGILAINGAEVRTAPSVREAIEILDRWRPDVLVSDIGMPGEDGLSLIRRVRALGAEHGGNVPAAAVTAFGSLDDRMRVLSAGFQLHVVKPVEPLELVAVVANLAGRGFKAG